MRCDRTGLARTAFLLSLCLFVAAGCDGGEGDRAGTEGPLGAAREIPLQTVVQGTLSDYGRFDQSSLQEEAPECTVIEDDQELQRLFYLAGLVVPEADVDFDAHVVLAAMQGAKNSAGYAISITRATQYGGEVRVEVEVVEPEESSFTAQILTSPYHLVMAGRDAFDPRGELDFIFVDRNGLVLSREKASV